MLTSSQPQSSFEYPKRVPHKKNSRTRKTLEDYEFVVDETSSLKTSDLGAGALGRVKRVRDKATGELYAMKIMNKQNIFRYSSKENLKNEVAIQKSMEHPHIVKLYHYFEDKDNVYIILGLAENGSLFDYIRAKKKVPENEAFVYFFQTALGVNYLHKNNIIHRDLKPENLLLDKNGNIKLCDFGWSAETHSKRATFCGTVDYMAPEMIKNQPYDHRIDIWSLGILLYELLHGYAPFQGKTDQERSFNISRNSPIFFNHLLSPEVCDLIRGLLRSSPADRLTMDEIFRHSWMKKYEQIYQIDLMSYVKEQDGENHNERSSSERDSLRYSEEGPKTSTGETQKNSGQVVSLGSLEDSDKTRGYHNNGGLDNSDNKHKEGQWRSYGNLSTKGSERNSGDFMSPHQYYTGSRESHSKLKFNNNSNSLSTIVDDEKMRPRHKYPTSVDTSSSRHTGSDGMDRGSLVGADTLSAMFRKNVEIEKKLHGSSKSKPNFFTRLLMDWGCITRDSKKTYI